MVCMKSSDASVKRFTWQVYGTSGKSRKIVLIMNKGLWKNKLNFVKDVPMVYLNFIYNCNFSF